MIRRALLGFIVAVPASVLLAGCADSCSWAEPDGEPCDGDRDEPCVCTAADGHVLDIDHDQSAWRARHGHRPANPPPKPPAQPAGPPVQHPGAPWQPRPAAPPAQPRSNPRPFK